MAKKIVGIFKKKKKPATPAPTATDGQPQPVVTPLSALAANSPLRKRIGMAASTSPTILGGGGLLGQ